MTDQVSDEMLDQILDSLYKPFITDLEADEYHGNNRTVIYLDDNLKAKLKQWRDRQVKEARKKQLKDCIDIAEMQLGGSKDIGAHETIRLFRGYLEQLSAKGSE